MFSESALLDLPGNIPVPPDLSEHIQTIAKTERLCNDVLNPKTRIFRRRSNRAQKKFMRNFLGENDVNPEDTNDVTKLLSLDIIQKGYEEINSATIRKGFSLAKYYIEQTKEFDPIYFREILDSARSFFAGLIEDDELHNLIKQEVTIMIDMLLGDVQNFIEPKEELKQNESYFYRVAGDFAALFLEGKDSIKQAYEYYETGIQRGNISCYVPFCQLLEEAGEIDNAIIIAENGWNTFQNRLCLEDYIRLLYKKGDEQSVGTAGIAYQKYMVLFPDDYKPIHKFRIQFNLRDLPTIDDDLIDIHAMGSGDVLEKEFVKNCSKAMIGLIARNARTLRSMNERFDLLDSVAGNHEYQEILTEQLILLERGAFDFLDSQFLPGYIQYLKSISEENLGYNFLMNFFEYHSVPHVDLIVAMSEQHNNPNADTEKEDTFAQKVINHFTFLLYHYAFTDEGLVDDLVSIAENLHIEPEMIESLEEANDSMQEFRKNLDILPENLLTQFLGLRMVLSERYGEMFVRKMEHNILQRFGSIQAGKMDIEARLYAFSLGCIGGNHVARENAMATINAIGINEEQAKYIGQMLREITLYQEAIEVLVGYTDLRDIDVLDSICQIGTVTPELVPVIHTDFTQRLDDMEREVVQIQYFLEEMEEDIRQGGHMDASLPKIQRVLAMAYWMEGKNILKLLKRKNHLDSIENAEQNFRKALNLFDSSLEGTVQKLQENPTSKEVRKEYRDIAKWFGEFIMQHSPNQTQAYGLLLNAFEQCHDMTVLHLLAQVSINLDLRDEAHKWITLMDQENDPDATELWLQYYFAGTSLSDKMTAVYQLLTTESEALQFIDGDLIDTIQGYAKQQFAGLIQRANKTDEEETHLLHLERCHAASFEEDIDRAREYWKKLGQMIGEGQIERLNEHFVLYVEPDVHADINPKLSLEKKEAQHLLTNLLEEAYTFRHIFKKDEDFLLLSYDMMNVFYALPDNLGVGFVDDILSQARAAEHERVAEDMKIQIEAQEELRLKPTIH